MVWDKVKEVLAENMAGSDFSLWIEPLECARANNHAVELVGPDRYFCSWVNNNYMGDIKAAVQAVAGEDVSIQIRELRNDETGANQESGDTRQEQLRLPSIPEARSSVRTLHPRYTFDEFMVGDSNALAHSACHAVASGSEAVSPCVFIEAGTGLGKSHLTHAVAHHILNTSPATRLHYVTSQQLTAEMVRHIKNNTMDQFKDKYHSQCDVLLMEDLQSLAGRTKTQAELAEALDILMDSGKKVILTGSMAPRSIPDIDDGIRSRLAAGLITTINPPDKQTRQLIILRKARHYGLELTEDLVEYMVDNLHGDIRRVEGAIVGLKAKASLLKAAPDLDMVKEVVASVVGIQPELSVVTIRDFVAEQYNLPATALKSKSRKKTIAFPRQVSMYLARQLTEHALSEIGKAFNRDHSTVVHSIRVITDAITRNGSIRGQVEHLAERLKKQSR